MAKIPNTKTIQKDQDLAEAGSWIDKLLVPINLFIQSVTSALSSNLTLEENLDAQIEDVETQGQMPLIFKLKTARRPRAVFVGRIINVDNPSDTFPVPVWHTWELGFGGNVKVTNITGLTIGTRYRVTFVVMN